MNKPTPPPLPDLDGSFADGAAAANPFWVAMELVSEAVLLIDCASGALVNCNPRAEVLLGQSREALRARWPDVPGLPFASHAAVLTFCQRAVAHGLDATPLQGHLVSEDGRTTTIDYTYRAMTVGGNQFAVLAARELSGVTAQAAEIVELRAQLERIRAVSDAVADTLALIDPSTSTYVDVNATLCNLLGYSRAELVGARLELVVLGEHTPQDYQKAFDDIIARYPEALTVERELRRRDGSLVSLELSRRAMKSEGRWLIVVTGRDISERKKAQAELDRFRAAIDLAGDSVVLIDPVAIRYIDVNQRTCDMVGYPRADLLNLDITQLTTGDITRDELRSRYQQVIDQFPNATVSEGLMRRADGTFIPVEHTRKAAYINGQWIIVINGRDITERKKAEAEIEQRMEELRRSNEELEQFAYIASHDLSEPLRMVSGYTQLLARRYKDKLDNDAHDFIGFAVDGADRMKQLIDDLLAYSRVTRTAKKPVDLDMDEALSDTLKNLMPLISDKGARIEREPLPRAVADRTSVIRVFQNLIGNALKFHANDVPVIRIGAQASATHVTFSVADNGIGISSDYFERIFQIFKRLHTREKYEGTGLGLAICKRIVEFHGGHIWLTSTPGEGSCFYFSLPAVPTRPEPG